MTIPAPTARADPLGGLDEFDAEVENNTADVGASADNVHIRVQQRNGRKSLTTVCGLDPKFDKKRILKALKKEYCCNGCIIEDDASGQVIQLQGDQRKNVALFLTGNKIVKKESLKIHGF